MRQKTNTQTKIGFVIFGTLCLAFFVIMLFAAKNNFKENKLYSFKGVVDSVSYDIKGIPTVIINKKTFYLSAGYNFDHQIKKEDSLVKQKGSTTYILIKPTKEVLKFDN